jgi:hypothetical protein
MKLITVLFICISISSNLFSQDCKSPYSVTVDFGNKTVSFPCKDHFQRGDAVQVIVKNYNPYLYKVSINNSDTSTAVPAEGQIFSWFLNPSNLSAITGNISSLTAGMGRALPADEKQVEDSYSDRMVTQQFDNFRPQTKARVQTLVATKPPKQTLTQIAQEDLKRWQDWTSDEVPDIESINDDITAGLYTLSAATDDQYKLTPPPTSIGQTFIEARKTDLQDHFGTWRKEVKEELDTVKIRHSIFTLDIADYIPIFKKNSRVRVGDSLINLFFVESISLLTKMDSLLSYPELQKRKTALLQLESLTDTYTTLPQYFLKDVKQLSIQVLPWNDSLKLSSFSTNIELPQLHHFILGVSGGFYISGLADQTYGFDTAVNSPAVGDTAYTLVKTNKGTTEIGVSTMAYGAWRLMNKFYFGPTLGAGISLASKPKPRFFLGGTFVLGETNRLMISGGLAAGFSTDLSPIFQSGKPYSHLPQNFTTDQMRSSWFISINYSFLGN